MSLGIPNLAVTCWVLTHICVEAGSQGVARVRPAQTAKSWQCEERALLWLGMQGKNGPFPRAIQLSLSQILPGGDETQSEVG